MSTPYNWEPELDVPDADLETLWGEFYANLDAARDEAVPDPEDDAPVPYWPALQPLTTEQLTARLAQLAEQRQSTSATAPVCSQFVPASGGAHHWCEVCGWRAAVHSELTLLAFC